LPAWSLHYFRLGGGRALNSPPWRMKGLFACYHSKSFDFSGHVQHYHLSKYAEAQYVIASRGAGIFQVGVGSYAILAEKLLTGLPLFGFGHEQKKTPCRIPTVGIVRKVLSTRTQLSHKHQHHHHGGAVCPSYGVVSLDTPDRTQATSSEGVGQERVGLV